MPPNIVFISFCKLFIIMLNVPDSKHLSPNNSLIVTSIQIFNSSSVLTKQP